MTLDALRVPPHIMNEHPGLLCCQGPDQSYLLLILFYLLQFTLSSLLLMSERVCFLIMSLSKIEVLYVTRKDFSSLWMRPILGLFALVNPMLKTLM